MKKVLFALLVIPVLAVAEEAPIPKVDSWSAFLDQLPAWFYATAVVVVDFIARKWPTAKPRSLFRLIGAGAMQISNLLEAFSKVLDKVVADKTK